MVSLCKLGDCQVEKEGGLYSLIVCGGPCGRRGIADALSLERPNVHNPDFLL